MNKIVKKVSIKVQNNILPRTGFQMQRIDKVAIGDSSYNPCRDFQCLENIEIFNFSGFFLKSFDCWKKGIDLFDLPILAPGSTTKTEKEAINAPSSGGCKRASDRGSCKDRP